MSTPLTRRRFLAIAATFAAGVGIPFPSAAKPISRLIRPARIRRAASYLERHCIGFGRGMRLFGVERKQAEILVNKVLAEVSRLEKYSACIGTTA